LPSFLGVEAININIPILFVLALPKEPTQVKLIHIYVSVTLRFIYARVISHLVYKYKKVEEIIAKSASEIGRANDSLAFLLNSIEVNLSNLNAPLQSDLSSTTV
jgi:hypothetical protein